MLADGTIDKPFLLYAVAFAVAFARARAEIKSEWKRPLSILQMTLTLAWIGLSGIMIGVVGDKPDVAIVFAGFLIVLPVVNGSADWLSLWVSRHLAGTLLEQASNRDGKKLAFLIVWDLLRDLAAALFLLAILAFSLAFMMQAISRIRGFGYDVTTEIARAAADPFGEGFWLAAILFSTLIPTAAHALLLLLSPLSLHGPAKAERTDWADILESPHFRPKNATHQQIAYTAARWSTLRNDTWATLLRFLAVAGSYTVIGGILWLGWLAIFGPNFGPSEAIAWIAELGVRAVPF